MYQGHNLKADLRDDGIVHLCFDRGGESINKFDARTVRELREAIAAIAAAPGVRGVLITSAKDVFIVGADITEFTDTFRMAQDALVAHIERSNEVFVALEDLGVPTLAEINGYAFGGGLELPLAAQLRVMSTTAQVGVPEVKLGLFPGFGGTVRLPRVAGAAAAAEWVSSGAAFDAEAALRDGVVDAIAAPGSLRDASTALLRQAIAGEVDWRARRQRKLDALADLPAARAAYDQAAVRAEAISGKHQPARLAAVELMKAAAPLDRAGALAAEARAFAHIALTQAAGSLVRTFLDDQALKKGFRKHAAGALPVRKAAVLGAGIMGGGIAYATALAGVAVRMKDVSAAQLERGMDEFRKQLARWMKRGKSQADADRVASLCVPQLGTEGFGEVDLVIEAVPEKLALKLQVLADTEKQVGAHAIIASNTSSLRIDDLARGLARPANFVGMHFFNPVPVMRLVEVIRGSRTSDAAVSTAVAHAVAMGKSPVVVKDCPGFLINRILTHYTCAFLQVVADGADFVQVDRALEAFGWPMGPALLQDVVGMDTGAHVVDVISAGYPDRMPPLAHNALKLMVSRGRLGQKSGLGFYRYETDPAGKPRKRLAEDSHALLAEVQPQGTRHFDDAELVERLMLPLVLEAGRALEDGIVGSAAELDMALLLGVGFPAYLGGALHYADWLGMPAVIAQSDKYAHLGPAYRATDRMRRMAAEGETYHG
ncbi:fatty acid oxidation complex subunit alpha FadB [Variovorax sp. PBL-E5]|uniref:fatty acid oxidation complex subunit alpha FadB n=1 Tax=Variovorax sp. PBL-E5 TaxID=434014 RepID=UPI00131651CC|nr:fatty acid oxidation complex subunit alpha FadB [Variovorax sp. PBL-E5]VTU39975.1 Fatty acid oxidation complex subunit alpha [Variovorax sp. PBL-E5]